ncbi:FecCD family ABC transporter permease [Priestia taiwanensis]|uniref:Ferrichrome ABC transporter permease n=1 Tax=Priestia taiwanensis TaxID=1347902 RepID=A0A917AY63_9BACI|nr:iron ABC transporter permease [Priestia taiwanensis]MBM7364885.1 iron complex transport system permease protein [Priestia taiwanensis]GGE82911.1 ferrichrome ABC transporter permease [Priestia taiwanensis]
MGKDIPRSAFFSIKLLLAFLLLGIMFVIAMTFGAADTTVHDVWLATMTEEVGDKLSMIREIRLPREVGAIFIGAALAVSGAIMQGITRNPLADPGLLGLTAGASAALAITIALIPSANYYAIMIACFIGAAIGATMVFGISMMKKGPISPFRIVLAGAAVSAFLQAVSEGVGIYFKISKDVSMWTSGGLNGTTWEQLHILIPIITVTIFIALFLGKQLTILSLSEDVAVGLGQKVFLIKMILFLAIIVLAGASVALVGNLTFLGLIIPHLVRPIVGSDYRLIIPMCAVLGATFMLLADTIGRTINAPYETSIAAIISIVGLPFFLYILRKGGNKVS